MSARKLRSVKLDVKSHNLRELNPFVSTEIGKWKLNGPGGSSFEYGNIGLNFVLAPVNMEIIKDSASTTCTAVVL